MVLTYSRAFLSNFSKKLWPCYRGKRAGRLVKAREATRRYNIPRVQTKLMDHAEENFNSRCHNPANCIQVATNPPTTKPAVESQNILFIPSMFLSNVMSLSPKIDEVSHVVQNANFYLVCISEIWLQQHIPDSAVAINGYSLIRRDRQETIHGGVCMYVKQSIPFSILDNINDENGLEVLWVKLRPTRLPRGISSIVAGVVYHPLKAANSPMLDYVTKCLIELEAKHPNCGIVVLGDLNQLNEARLKSNFNLKQIVHFPTRGKSSLDKILTNLKDYYDPPMERLKFVLSNHSSVEVQPKQRAKTSQSKQTIIFRDLRLSKRHAMRTYLEQVDVSAMISAVDSCEGKVSVLQTVIHTGLDYVLPLKTKTVISAEPPWIIPTLKKLIKKGQRALRQGRHAEFTLLRNRINRERKSCRSKYYESRVEHLKECSPADCWKEVKRLGGVTNSRGARDSVLKSVHHLEGVSDLTPKDLANHINTAFLTPTEAFELLPHNPFQDDSAQSANETGRKIATISELSVLRSLSALNVTTGRYPGLAVKRECRPISKSYHRNPKLLISRGPTTIILERS